MQRGFTRRLMENYTSQEPHKQRNLNNRLGQQKNKTINWVHGLARSIPKHEFFKNKQPSQIRKKCKMPLKTKNMSKGLSI